MFAATGFDRFFSTDVQVATESPLVSESSFVTDCSLLGMLTFGSEEAFSFPCVFPWGLPLEWSRLFGCVSTCPGLELELHEGLSEVEPHSSYFFLFVPRLMPLFEFFGLQR